MSIGFEAPVIYSGGHPFSVFIDAMFKRIIDAVNDRKPEVFAYEARKLKLVCEIFMHSNLPKALNLELTLWHKFDYVVNFSRWLSYNSDYHTYILNEYYINSVLKRKLIEHILYVKNNLIIPLADLINYDLKEDRKYALRKLRYIPTTKFDHNDLIDKIKKDYLSGKSIEEISRRRNPNIGWNICTKNEIHEKIIERELKVQKILYIKNVNISSRKVPHSEFDFLISDGKNSLSSIESKSGKVASKTNELIIFSKKNNHLNITNSKFIGFKTSWDNASKKNMIVVSKLLGIIFESRISK